MHLLFNSELCFKSLISHNFQFTGIERNKLPCSFSVVVYSKMIMNPSVSESGTYCIYLAALWLSKNQLLFTSTSVNNCKMFFPMDGKLVHHKLPSNSWVKGGIVRVKCLIQECRTRFSQVARPDLLTLSPECQPFDQWVFQTVGSVAFLTFNTLTSVCIFSLLFSIHFPGC